MVITDQHAENNENGSRESSPLTPRKKFFDNRNPSFLREEALISRLSGSANRESHDPYEIVFDGERTGSFLGNVSPG